MKYYILYGLESSGTRYFTNIMGALGLGGGVFFAHVFKTAKDKEDIKSYYGMCLKNNVWGSKIHSHADIEKALDIIFANQNISSNPMKFLNRLCPDVKFIYLSRLNKLKQAVSWARNRKIGVKLAATGDSLSDYTDEDILKWVKRICYLESLALNFFEENNIKPLYITYEELCDDKTKVVRRVLQFLEIPEKPGQCEIIGKKRFPQRKYCDVRDALYRRMQKFLSSSRIWKG